jgi:hypothetical protein
VLGDDVEGEEGFVEILGAEEAWGVVWFDLKF